MKTLTSGERFGDYLVVRRLGKGGMGEVWLLRSTQGNDVAAKILDAEASSDHEARKRFLREAQLALGVKHPNLVETYDVGEDPETGLCYILMEYVPGGTLADYIRQTGALPIKDAIAVTEAIAGVLELGRQKGIVHRDIKPANIMFDAEGTPKLADLGIARAGGGTETTTVTQTGAMIGTPAYMSPEQMLDSHNVDTRADIYSLGIVLYEMLTGERPHKDDTVVQLMARAMRGEPLPDVRTLRPEVSASLAHLLSMMVLPDRDGRISTPGQVSRALYVIRRGGKYLPPQAVSRMKRAAIASWKRKVPWNVLVPVAILTVLATTFFLLSRRKPPRPISPASVPENPPAPVRQEPAPKVETPAPKVETPAPKVKVSSKSDVPAQVPTALSNGLYSVRLGDSTWVFGKWHTGDNDLRSPETRWYMWERDDCPCAVTPRPTGHLVVPSAFGEQPLTRISRGAILNCPGLQSVEIPESVRALGPCAFLRCNDLTDVRLPKSLEGIYGVAFRKCEKLKELDLRSCQKVDGPIVECCPEFTRFRCDPDNPYLTTDEGGSLYDRSMQTLFRWLPARLPVVLPASVTTLAKCSLAELEISGLVLPNSITTVKDDAFGSLTLAVLVLPKSVRTIDLFAFRGAMGLKCLVFEGDAPAVETGDRKGNVFDQNTRGDLNVFLKKGTKGWRADGSEGLPATWPDGRPGSRHVVAWETLVDLRESIRKCGESYPDKPQTKRLPDPRRQSGTAAEPPKWMRFAKAGGFVWKYKLCGNEARICSTEDFWAKNYEGAVSPQPTGRLSIPSRLDGHPVTELGTGVFVNCPGLTAVEIPEGVRFLGPYVFFKCPDLEEIRFPKSLQALWEAPVVQCKKLKQLDLGMCRLGRGHPVRECSAFSKFTCDPGNKYLLTDERGALYDRARQTLYQWPAACRPIRIPRTVTCLERGSLAGLDIRQFFIPRTVVSLKGNVFHTARHLELLAVPQSVRTIEDETFHGLGALKALVFERDAPKLEKGSLNHVFENAMPQDIVVFIREGTKGWRADGKAGIPKTWPDGAANARRTVGWQKLSDLQVACEALGMQVDLSGWSTKR